MRGTFVSFQKQVLSLFHAGMGMGMASRPVCVAAQKRGDSADPFSILALLSMRCCVGKSDGDLYGGLWVYIGDYHPVYM